MNIPAIYQTSKPHKLAREINKLVDGIERESKLAGQHLATLKAGKPPGITWEHYLKDCGVKVSARHADRLIEAYQGPTRKSPIKPTPDSDIVSEPDDEIIDESAEAMKAQFAELDAPANVEDDQTKEPPRAEVANLIRAWVQASPEAKREFVRERWDEISQVRRRLDANGAATEDRWIESEEEA